MMNNKYATPRGENKYATSSFINKYSATNGTNKYATHICNIKKLIIAFLICGLFFSAVLAHGGDEEPSENDSTSLQKIELSKEQEKILGLKTAIIKLSPIQAGIEVNGIIEEIPNLHFQVNSPVKGRISNINVTLGSQVSKGQILAILESQEVTQLAANSGADQANYRLQLNQAKANLDLEKKRYEREKSLYEHKINTQKDLEAAENALKNAQASLKAAEQNLVISNQSTQRQLSQIGGNKNGQVYLRAPLAGQISEINMTLGQSVDLGQNLLHGVNLAQVWASGQVFEKDINKVKLKQKVQVFTNDSLEAMFGEIVFINPLIDQSQRSFAVKTLLNNSARKLKAGQFIQMKIETGGKPEQAILIEKDCLIEKNGEQFVYIRSGKFLIPSKVKISPHKHQDYAEIEAGLAVGDEIVVEGAYLLPSQGSHSEQESEYEHKEKPEKLPLWVWLVGGGFGLMAAFLAGRKFK